MVTKIDAWKSVDGYLYSTKDEADKADALCNSKLKIREIVNEEYWSRITADSIFEDIIWNNREKILKVLKAIETQGLIKSTSPIPAPLNFD